MSYIYNVHILTTRRKANDDVGRRDLVQASISSLSILRVCPLIILMHLPTLSERLKLYFASSHQSKFFNSEKIFDTRDSD